MSNTVIEFEANEIIVLEEPKTWTTGEANFCGFCNPVVHIK